MIIVIEHLPCAGKSRNRAQSLPLKRRRSGEQQSSKQRITGPQAEEAICLCKSQGNRKQKVRRTPWEHGEAVQKMCFSTHVYLKGRKETVQGKGKESSTQDQIYIQVSQFNLSVVSDSLRPLGLHKPGFPDHHQLPELAQTHIHRVSDAIQPSHPVIPFSSHLQSFPASGSFLMSQFFASGGQILEFQLQHQPFQ